MTIKVSVDECKNWSISKLVWSGFAAYSCMQKLPGGNMALFFECGEKGPYETLRFLSFQPKELFQPGTLISGN